jgi:Mn2+/Fe2+ NRAMP family transporter
VIALATLLGMFVNVSSIGSMTMLYYAAMLNGVLAPPLLFMILRIANNKAIMGSHSNGWLSNLLNILVLCAMTAVSLLTIGVLFA